MAKKTLILWLIHSIAEYMTEYASYPFWKLRQTDQPTNRPTDQMTSQSTDRRTWEVIGKLLAIRICVRKQVKQTWRCGGYPGCDGLSTDGRSEGRFRLQWWSVLKNATNLGDRLQTEFVTKIHTQKCTHTHIHTPVPFNAWFALIRICQCVIKYHTTSLQGGEAGNIKHLNSWNWLYSALTSDPIRRIMHRIVDSCPLLWKLSQTDKKTYWPTNQETDMRIHREFTLPTIKKCKL